MRSRCSTAGMAVRSLYIISPEHQLLRTLLCALGKNSRDMAALIDCAAEFKQGCFIFSRVWQGLRRHSCTLLLLKSSTTMSQSAHRAPKGYCCFHDIPSPTKRVIYHTRLLANAVQIFVHLCSIPHQRAVSFRRTGCPKVLQTAFRTSSFSQASHLLLGLALARTVLASQHPGASAYLTWKT